MKIDVDCPRCGLEDAVELDIVIDSGPIAPVFSLPEYSSPGEGAEWHIEEPVTCDRCGPLTDAEIQALAESDSLNETVQERATESVRDDGPDWEPDEDDR